MKFGEQVYYRPQNESITLPLAVITNGVSARAARSTDECSLYSFSSVPANCWPWLHRHPLNWLTWNWVSFWNACSVAHASSSRAPHLLSSSPSVSQSFTQRLNLNTVRRRSRRTFSTHWDFSTTFRRRRNLLFQFRLQIFRRRVGIFSHFFLCYFYCLLKVHVNFV